MQGVTTQVSDLNISIACTTDLNKKPDTRGAALSLLRMRNILLQTFFARAKFLTNSGQSLSVSEINCPRYLKEVIIFRGRP